MKALVRIQTESE